MTSMPADAANETYESRLSQTQKTETNRQYVGECQNQILREVVEMEVKLGIEKRWSFESAEYQGTMCYMTMRQYHCAADKCQKLVVQRLFELHKLNLNHTGMGYTVFSTAFN
jgi:hypothetical protein